MGSFSYKRIVKKNNNSKIYPGYTKGGSRVFYNGSLKDRPKTAAKRTHILKLSSAKDTVVVLITSLPSFTLILKLGDKIY